MIPELSSPYRTTLSITNTCNLDCVYCYSRCTKKAQSKELTTDEWKGAIDQLIEAGVVHLFIEGGEPLYRLDILDILHHCRHRVMTWIRTNGTLVTPKLATDLQNAGVSTMLVDIHGAKPETHDLVVGHPGSHKRAVEGARHLVAAGFRVYLLLVLNRHNYQELQDYAELAKEIGAARIGILRLYPLGKAREKWEELALSLDEMTDVLQAIELPDGLEIMQSWHPKNKNCCYHASAISAFGDSIGCPYLRDFVNYGNLRDTPFIQTWKDPLWQRLRAGNVEEGGCASCSESEMSKGGCRSTAFAFTGNWDGHDPFCETMNKGIDLRALPTDLAERALK